MVASNIKLSIRHLFNLPSSPPTHTIDCAWLNLDTWEFALSSELSINHRVDLIPRINKGFIHVSNSPAIAPVLFIKKPGSRL